MISTINTASSTSIQQIATATIALLLIQLAVLANFGYQRVRSRAPCGLLSSSSSSSRSSRSSSVAAFPSHLLLLQLLQQTAPTVGNRNLHTVIAATVAPTSFASATTIKPPLAGAAAAPAPATVTENIDNSTRSTEQVKRHALGTTTPERNATIDRARTKSGPRHHSFQVTEPLPWVLLRFPHWIRTPVSVTHYTHNGTAAVDHCLSS